MLSDRANSSKYWVACRESASDITPFADMRGMLNVATRSTFFVGTRYNAIRIFTVSGVAGLDFLINWVP